MSAAPILEVRGLRKRFGGLVVSDDIDLTVEPGEIHAVIGPNGAGKTTLIGQLSGEIAHDAGEIRLDGRRVDGLPVAARVGRGLARTFQITSLLPDFSVLENVVLTLQARRGHSFRLLRPARADAALFEVAARHLADGGLGDRGGAPVADLSHGEAKQLELVIALALTPRLLLLDEPMAGLGQAESRDMVDRLAALRGRLPMLLVEHDMDAVFSLADRVSVLVYGRIVASGGVAEIRANPAVREAYLGEEAAAC